MSMKVIKTYRTSKQSEIILQKKSAERFQVIFRKAGAKRALVLSDCLPDLISAHLEYDKQILRIEGLNKTLKAPAQDCDDCGGQLPNCDCEGMREMTVAGLKASGTL